MEVETENKEENDEDNVEDNLEIDMEDNLKDYIEENIEYKIKDKTEDKLEKKIEEKKEDLGNQLLCDLESSTDKGMFFEDILLLNYILFLKVLYEEECYLYECLFTVVYFSSFFTSSGHAQHMVQQGPQHLGPIRDPQLDLL